MIHENGMVVFGEWYNPASWFGGGRSYQEQLDMIKASPSGRDAFTSHVDWVLNNWYDAYQYSDLRTVMDDNVIAWGNKAHTDDSVAAAVWVHTQASKRTTGQTTAPVQNTVNVPAAPNKPFDHKLITITPKEVPSGSVGTKTVVDADRWKKLALNAGIAIAVLATGYFAYSKMSARKTVKRSRDTYSTVGETYAG